MIKQVVCIAPGRLGSLVVGKTYDVFNIYSCKCKTQNIAYDIGERMESLNCYCPICNHYFPEKQNRLASAYLFVDLEDWQDAEQSVNQLLRQLEVNA